MSPASPSIAPASRDRGIEAGQKQLPGRVGATANSPIRDGGRRNALPLFRRTLAEMVEARVLALSEDDRELESLEEGAIRIVRTMYSHRLHRTD
jgi:hypothetical protein